MPTHDPPIPSEPASVSIVRLELADADRVVPLLDEYRQFQGATSDVDAAREFLRARLRNGESVVFLAQVEGRPAGFAQVYPSFSTASLAPVMILNDLFVAPAFRRMRVGSALLSVVEAYSWSRNAARLQLNVARSNTRAQALYLGNGWKNDDEYFMFLRYPPAG